MLEDKICGFSVNEFHLVTMIMPYIYEAVNAEKKVTTFFEKDVDDIYERLVNINEEYWKNRELLDKIDWKKVEISNLAKKFENIGDILIISGKKDFIDRINSLAVNFHKKFTLINCFEIDDFNNDMKNIIKDYEKILCTTGIREIKELYLV